MSAKASLLSTAAIRSNSSLKEQGMPVALNVLKRDMNID
tara:strand:+ start:21 stop:137 length:117 start_codon:yes stop_codon:yes gene_type:complete